MKRMSVVLAVGLLSSGLAGAPARASTSTAAQQVAAFWLGDGGANLRNATPYDVQAEVTGGVLPGGGVWADGKAAQIPPLPLTDPDPAQRGTPATAGKVFFVGTDGLPHWCTGTAVQTAYRNLVATAGHCVYDDQVNAATLDKWAFVPGYAAGATPSGLYVGRRAFAHGDFRLYKDFDRDYAFVTVFHGVVPSPEGGLTDVGRLVDNVGGQGLAYNRPEGDQVDVFGYPAGPHPNGTRPYTGETLESSRGRTVAVSVPGLPAEALIGVDSRFTGAGALGSAWLAAYDNDARVGYLNGITISVADTDGDSRYDTSLSPYFDGELGQVHRAGSAMWTGSIV